MSSGYVKLYRSLQDHDLWIGEPFTRGQAWVDLLMLANHKDGHIRVRGNRMAVKRGQVGWSVARLAERWGWSRWKVQHFLDELQNQQQIQQHKGNVSSLITLVNYEKYQQGPTAEQTAEPTADRQQTDTNKKGKNGKKKTNGQLELPSWLPDELWQDFKAHRKAARKPLTPQGEKLNLNKLDRLRQQGHDPEQIIGTAIERGWLSFYPPHEHRRGNGAEPPTTATRRLLE